MVNEEELRAHLTSSEQPAIEIDTAAIISRSKARRRPRQLAVGAVGLLAAASLVFAGVATFPRNDTVTSAGIAVDEASSRAESDAGADASESYLAPSDSVIANACGAFVPSTSASPYGLALELELPSPVTASGSAFGTVRLTNTSETAVTGTTASVPDVNLTRDGVSVSHSPDQQILSVIPVNLQPGQSIEFAISLRVYDCTSIDSGGMLDPGTYAVSTSLGFVPTDPDDGEAAEVRSAPLPIVLQ